MEWSCLVHTLAEEVLTSPANAALTPRQRLRIAHLIVDEGSGPSRGVVLPRLLADCEAVGRPVHRDGYRGHARPVLETAPVPEPDLSRAGEEDRCAALRWRKRLGPVGIAGRLGLPASTVHAVLTRCRVNRLHHIDIRTGEVVRRYEHDHPGSLIHVDVKKLGNIPDGGGWRYVGRQQGLKNRAATPGKPRNAHHNPKVGIAFVHTVIDDHSRVAYAEIHNDETAVTAIGVLRRAVSWFHARGVRVERVLSDNGSAYRSHAWRDACHELDIAPKKTRPYRPQTNGKIERFHRTLADG